MSFKVNNVNVLAEIDGKTGVFTAWNPGVRATESAVPASTAGTVFYVKNYNGQGPKFIYFNNSQEIV